VYAVLPAVDPAPYSLVLAEFIQKIETGTTHQPIPSTSTATPTTPTPNLDLTKLFDCLDFVYKQNNPKPRPKLDIRKLLECMNTSKLV
jgi:hypothetical protein